MQRLVRGFTFVLSAALAMIACHHSLKALRINPHFTRPAVPPPLQERFLSNYNGFGLDFIWLRHDLLGTSKPIRRADVICSSSSKGLFGIDAAQLGQRLSRPGQPVRVYNMAFPCCESFAYPIEVIKSLDLHDKILLADVTDQTCVFKLSGMGAEAMRTTNKLDAYKLVAERSLGFWRDWLLTGIVPRFEFEPERGFRVRPSIAYDSIYRLRATGDYAGLPSGDYEPVRWPKAVHYGFEFPYRELEKPFFEECRRRNIRIVFISIPYEGYDPEFGAQVARTLNLPHARVEHHGIPLGGDGIHMRGIGRRMYTDRLADRLLSPGIDIQERVAQVHEHRPTPEALAAAARSKSASGGTPTAHSVARQASYNAPLLGGDELLSGDERLPGKPAPTEPPTARPQATPPRAFLK